MFFLKTYKTVCVMNIDKETLIIQCPHFSVKVKHKEPKEPDSVVYYRRWHCFLYW